MHQGIPDELETFSFAIGIAALQIIPGGLTEFGECKNEGGVADRNYNSILDEAVFLRGSGRH